jgi:hypothetical protein
MLWVIEGILLILIVLLPRYRKWGIALAVVFGLLLLWAMQRSNFGGIGVKPATTTTAGIPNVSAITALPLNTAQAEHLKLTGSGAPWRFTGRLRNLSDKYQITSASFDIARADCYENTGSPSGCLNVWQGKQTVAISVPPLQARDFSIDIWLRGSALRLKGTAQDQFSLVALSGRPIGNPSP